MSDNPKPDKELENLSSSHHADHCVQCGGALKLYLLKYDTVAMFYCPNPDCPNYGLVTVGMSGVDNG